jgi:hypothetical protein
LRKNNQATILVEIPGNFPRRKTVEGNGWRHLKKEVIMGIEFVPGFVSGVPGGLGDGLEADSVKMIDMGELDGFRDGLSRLIAACISIATVPVLAKILGKGKRVAIGVVAPDIGTGYAFKLSLVAALSKVGSVVVDVDEDENGARIYLGPEREAELLVVQDESDFDGTIMVGGSVLSNVVDAEKVLDQFRLRISATFQLKEES